MSPMCDRRALASSAFGAYFGKMGPLAAICSISFGLKFLEEKMLLFPTRYPVRLLADQDTLPLM